ncbi:MAG: SRPBCC family protein [Gemmatimonadota bacterium]
MKTTPIAANPSDQVEEQVQLPASRARVWRALTSPEELGAWFGVNLTGAKIAPGAHVTGHFTIPGHEDVVFDVTIEEMIPERRFAWRWHPHAIDSTADYSREKRTLVAFTLEDAPDGGTLLRVVESGFDALPATRRTAAFLGVSSGWRAQMQKRLPAYLASA